MQKDDPKNTSNKNLLATTGETSSLTLDGCFEAGSSVNSFDEDLRLFSKQSFSMGELPVSVFADIPFCTNDMDDTILSPNKKVTEGEKDIDLVSKDNLYVTNSALNDDLDDVPFIEPSPDEMKKYQILDKVPVEFLGDDTAPETSAPHIDNREPQKMTEN